MSTLADLLKSVAGLAILAGIAVLGLLAFFVAWWIAIAGILVFLVYALVRSLLPPGPPRKGGGTDAIEGEYRVEKDDD